MSCQFPYILLLTLISTHHLSASNASNADTIKASKRIAILCGHLKPKEVPYTATLPALPPEWQQSALAKWEPAQLKELAGWVRKKSQNSNTDCMQPDLFNKKS